MCVFPRGSFDAFRWQPMNKLQIGLLATKPTRVSFARFKFADIIRKGWGVPPSQST